MQLFVATFGLLSFFVISSDAGASMHNPFYCYANDNIRPQINIASLLTSYEAVRRFNFTTVNPYVSSKAFLTNWEYFVQKKWIFI